MMTFKGVCLRLQPEMFECFLFRPTNYIRICLCFLYDFGCISGFSVTVRRQYKTNCGTKQIYALSMWE